MRKDSCTDTRFHFLSLSGRQTGLTLPETLTVLTIVGILGSLGVTLGAAIREGRLTAAASELQAALSLARSSAINRNRDVVVCPSRDNKHCESPDSLYTWWQGGYLVFVDQDGDRQPDNDEPVLLSCAARDGVTLRSSRFRARVVYRPNGMATGTNLTFTLCPNGSSHGIRSIVISNTGRARISRKSADHLPCSS